MRARIPHGKANFWTALRNVSHASKHETNVIKAVSSLLAGDRLLDGVRGQLPPDAASQERAEAAVIPWMKEIAEVMPD